MDTIKIKKAQYPEGIMYYCPLIERDDTVNIAFLSYWNLSLKFFFTAPIDQYNEIKGEYEAYIRSLGKKAVCRIHNDYLVQKKLVKLLKTKG